MLGLSLGGIEENLIFTPPHHPKLYKAPNTHTIAWVDASRKSFKNMANECVALVGPLCAVGRLGALRKCTPARLIPVLNYQQGIDVHDWGAISIDVVNS